MVNNQLSPILSVAGQTEIMEAEDTSKLVRKNLQNNNDYCKPEVDTSKKETPKRKFTWGKCLKHEINPEEVIYKTAPLPEICTDSTSEGTPIQQFYSGAHVLVTGATGFMGKILVEKLLVSCPKLEKLYLIIREKKGLSMEERFDALFQEPVFARLRKMVPEFRKKVVPVNGDCSQLRLGVTDETYSDLIQKINIVIHGAATVRFDEHIRMATHINVRGVKEIMKLSRDCINLKSVVHISTAYSNCLPNGREVEEKFYPPGHDYEDLIKLVNEETPEKLAEMTPDLISPWPNTYAFTKQIAESVARKEGAGLPLCVYRPAVVIASATEPIRNWSDNIYGPTGVISGAGLGALRCVHAVPNGKCNYVPVDMAVNGVIAAAWKAEQEFKDHKGTKIYNYVATARNPITNHEFSYWNGIYGRRWPTVKAIWYPFFFIIQNQHLFNVLNFFLHTVPAYLVDALLFVTGQKTMLVKGYKKISKFVKVISYFTTRYWDFYDDNVVNLWNSMSSMDQKIYPFDIAELDWDLYSSTHLLALRVHLVHDQIDTIKQGRILYWRFLCLHIVLCGVISSLFFWLVFKTIGWIFY